MSCLKIDLFWIQGANQNENAEQTDDDVYTRLNDVKKINF